ncbi:hypothetical protein IV102_19210 [bacterium]|nr:hypothetical protein [bacterium]
MKPLICLLLLLLIGPAWAQPTRLVKTRMFETQVPTGWEERLTDAALYFLYPGKDTDNPEHAHISITPTKLSENMSLDSFTFMAKHTVENDYPELKLSSSRTSQLGKIDAHRFEYKGIRAGKKFQIIQVMAMSGRNGFTVEFLGSESDFNALRNGFEQMLKTFKTL